MDIGGTILVFEASRLPLQDMVYSMPFSCSDPLIVAETIKQIYSEYPEFTETYEKNYNQKFIGIGVSDPYGFYSTKEVRSLEDVNGMKIGAAGINLSWIEGSGAVGVQTSLNDTYQNLQTNVCQATIQPTRSCVNLKVYEVAPYYLDANFNVVPFNSITVNLDTWNDLPQEIQTILTEVGEGYLDYEANYINEVHEQDLKTLEEQGCTIVSLSREEQEKWAASLPDIVSGLVKSLDDAGYSGAEIVSRYYEILESHGEREENMSVLRKWDKLLERFLGMINGIAAISVFMIMLLITADVLSRFLLNKPFAGTAEIVSSIIIVVCFWEIPYVAVKGAHVRTTMLYDKAGRKGRLIIDMAAAGLGILVYGN